MGHPCSEYQDNHTRQKLDSVNWIVMFFLFNALIHGAYRCHCIKSHWSWLLIPTHQTKLTNPQSMSYHFLQTKESNSITNFIEAINWDLILFHFALFRYILCDIYGYLISKWVAVNWQRQEGTRLVKVGDQSISPSDDPPRKLGVRFDSTCRLDAHIAKLCISINHNIYSVGKIRKYLDRPTAEKMINATVASRLDYCNSLLYGAKQSHIDRLQCCQNNAVRIISSLTI